MVEKKPIKGPIPRKETGQEYKKRCEQEGLTKEEAQQALLYRLGEGGFKRVNRGE